MNYRRVLYRVIPGKFKNQECPLCERSVLAEEIPSRWQGEIWECPTCGSALACTLYWHLIFSVPIIVVARFILKPKLIQVVGQKSELMATAMLSVLVVAGVLAAAKWMPRTVVLVEEGLGKDA